MIISTAVANAYLYIRFLASDRVRKLSCAFSSLAPQTSALNFYPAPYKTSRVYSKMFYGTSS